MTKVQRRMLVKSEWVVEHGLDAQQRSPSQVLLEELKSGMWKNADSSKYPDEYLPGMYHRLTELIHRLGTGEELPMGSYNRLRDGVWELVVANARMTFFDTPGDGTYTAKVGGKREILGKIYWDLPEDFDEFIRLGVCWEKTTQKAPEPDITASMQFRTEDLSYDIQ